MKQKGSHFRVRFTLYRQSKGLYLPSEFNTGYFIEATPLPKANYTLNTVGLTLGTYTGQTKTFGVLSPLKTSNSLISVLGSITAKKSGFDDVLGKAVCVQVVNHTLVNVHQGHQKLDHL